MDLSNFPVEIFRIIGSYLEAADICCCQTVSRQWYIAFGSPQFVQHQLLKKFPRAREVRQLIKEDGNFAENGACVFPDTHRVRRDLQPYLSWSQLFCRVAARYHALASGHPRSSEKIKLERDWAYRTGFFSVAPWDRNLIYKGTKMKFQEASLKWTYDDGLLVYPALYTKQTYVLVDLEQDQTSTVPFDAFGRIVRRIRLRERVLIIEWCEFDSFHYLNQDERVHRHFASCYDVVEATPGSGLWQVKFRNEWKIHFLGLPLNDKDRFWTAHTTSHYVLYLWQPNRSAWGEDEPLESMIVWDIHRPSSYLPSNDTSGPGEAAYGPKVIKRSGFQDLDHYGIRQRSFPTFQDLDIDSGNIYFAEENMWDLRGDDATVESHTETWFKLRVTAIPHGDGPVLVHTESHPLRINERPLGDDCFYPHALPLLSHLRRKYKAGTMGGTSFLFPGIMLWEVFDEEANISFSSNARGLGIIDIKLNATRPRVYCSLTSNIGSVNVRGCERWVVGETFFKDLLILHFDRKKMSFLE